MARLLDLLKIGGGEEHEVLAVLQHLDKQRTPVRMEIEHTQTRFNTVVAMKRGMVVVAKPAGLRDEVKKERWVRFRVPGEDERELRMEIISPHFNLTNGQTVFLCKVPEGFSESSRRRAERFNTSRFSNLLLEVDESLHFRIIDVSLTGCKLFVRPDWHDHFPLGHSLHNAVIRLGSRVQVELEALIPRVHKGAAVGCEMIVRKQSHSMKYLSHLIHSLEKAEDERLRTEAL